MIFEYFRNRRSIGWFVGAGLLGLVIVAFVALYFPDFMGDPATAAMRRGVAWVDGEPIRASAFLDRYREVARNYQQQSGGDFSPAYARQLGLPEQVVGDLIRNRVLVLEAERQGLAVTDAEVATAIETAPSFQIGGSFIGRTAYLDRLRGARLNPRDFEASVRDDLLAEKLRLLVTEAPSVSDEELETEFRRRNESASIELWFVPSDAEGGEIAATAEEVRERFEADPAAFERPPQRRIRYLTLSDQLVADEVSVRQREIQRYYDRNLYLYQRGDIAEASHILIRPESPDEEEASRALAAELADRARSGEDFAELARAHSADETTAESGGALGSFGPEEMLPEFAAAVFALTPGEISDPVRTDYGFHVVRLDGLEPAETQEVAEVEEEITVRLRQEKARELLDARAMELEERVPGADSLEELVEGYPLLIAQEAEPFSRDEPVAELDSTEATRIAFLLEVGDVGGPVRISNGFAFVEVVEDLPPRVPGFEEIEDEVIARIEHERALEIAGRAAAELREQLAAGEAVESDPIPVEAWFRGNPLGFYGPLPAAEEVVFAAAPGELLGPFAAEGGQAVIRVREIRSLAPEDFEDRKDFFRAELQDEKKQRIWTAFLGVASERFEIRIDRQALYALIG